MRLRVCCSGSKGNGYILETENEVLVIECGASFKEIKKMLDYNILKISGVLISHEHS